MQDNIAQLEFFHVGGKNASSLDELFRECAKRSSDNLKLVLAGSDIGTGIKTTVRLYDSDGVLTKLATEAQANERRSQELWDEFGNARGFRRWHIDRQSRKCARLSIDYRRQALMLAGYVLADAVTYGREVAVECPDRTFRPLRDNEGHELVESASQAKGVWIFVFKPNFLYTDRNTMLVHVM